MFSESVIGDEDDIFVDKGYDSEVFHEEGRGIFDDGKDLLSNHHDKSMRAEGKRYNIEELRRILFPIAEEYGVKRIVLFGSSARGDYRGNSDYDFCVERGDLRGFRYGRFFMDVRSAVGAEIDMVTTAGVELDPDFMSQVEKDGVVIYER
ncbi:MAG: nucleotidyltransferase domain-containing protein [Methanomassiliicoccaceae archaeon]|nr:nucleotidyltransferase domain-containing protein [Methanomassiliicoccaceae archaeon]